MSLESLVEHFGLPLLFIGAGTEGEAVAVTGGLLAHRGVLPLWQVGLCVFGGSLVQGQLLFLMGRHMGHNAWVARLLNSPACVKLFAVIERHPERLILSFRFLFGLRTLSPLVIGASRVLGLTFFMLNIGGALIWAAAFIALGFVFGASVEHLFGRLPAHLHYGVAVLFGSCAIVAIYGWSRARSKLRRGQGKC